MFSESSVPRGRAGGVYRHRGVSHLPNRWLLMPDCPGCQGARKDGIMPSHLQRVTIQEHSRGFVLQKSLQWCLLHRLPWARSHQFLPGISWGLEECAKIRRRCFGFSSYRALSWKKKSIAHKLEWIINRWSVVWGQWGGGDAKEKGNSSFWEPARHGSPWPTVALHWHLLSVSF